METFGMNTGAVQNLGGKVVNNAEDFKLNNEKIYSIVDNLVRSHFTSPEAVELQNRLNNFKPILKQMEDALNDQGEHGIYSANKTAEMSDQLKDMVATNFSDFN